MSVVDSRALISLTLIAVVLFSGCIGTEEPEETTTSIVKSTVKETSTSLTTSTASNMVLTTIAATTSIPCKPVRCGELCRPECGCMEPTQECMLFANWRCRNPECPMDTDCVCDTTTSIEPTHASLYYKPDKPPSGAHLLKGVTSERYAVEYGEYAFKIDHFTYCAESKVCRVMMLIIPNPGEREVFKSVGWDECSNDFYDAKINNLVLRLGSVNTIGGEEIADIYVWDFNKHPVRGTVEPQKPPHPNAKLFTDITTEGYTSKYKGYAFKIDHLLFTGKYQISGMVLVVKKPSGEEVQVTLTMDEKAKVDNINILMPCGHAEEWSGGATGAIYVWES